MLLKPYEIEDGFDEMFAPDGRARACGERFVRRVWSPSPTEAICRVLRLVGCFFIVRAPVTMNRLTPIRTFYAKGNAGDKETAIQVDDHHWTVGRTDFHAGFSLCR